jgi:hypothetical protein
MRFMTPRRGTRVSWVSILGILCLVLILVTGIVQVTHAHTSGQIDHDCALCLTAHQAIQIAVVVTVLLVSHLVARFTSDDFTPLPRQRFVLKLAIRPPPVPVFFA